MLNQAMSARHRRHVLVEALVLLPVKHLESLGEARVQLVSRVSRRLEVGCGAHQGFDVGHKVLGDVRVLGKHFAVLGDLNGWEICGTLSWILEQSS